MPARRRTAFPGISKEASDQLIALQDDLSRDTASLRTESVGRTTDTKTAAYSARFNETIPCQMPAAGGALTFPGAGVATADKWIEVIVKGGGPVKVQPTSGLVQGVASESLTTPGRYMYRSDGLTSWWRVAAGSGGGLSPPVALTDLQTIADETFLGNVSGGVATPSAIALSSLAGTGLTWNSALNRLDAAGAAVAMTDATVTLSFASKQSDTVSVVDAAIGAGSKLIITWGTVLDTDANSPEFDDVTFTAIPAAGSMTLRISAADPLGRVGGDYKIRYLIG
jgi:hypothetical protein